MQLLTSVIDRHREKSTANPAETSARCIGIFLAGTVAFWMVLCSPAQARLGVSPVILDFQPDQPRSNDIELFNDGTDRVYVVVEPSEIKGAGTPAEQRIQMPDPKELGLLAAPNQLILEPGQRRFLRIVMLNDPADVDRIYRVTVKPVVGEIESSTTGVKILVGYDVLVIQRPLRPKSAIVGSRSATTLTLTNGGNSNAELFSGRECDAGKRHCNDLPGHRLYAGASWTVPIIANDSVEYSIKTGATVSTQNF